MSGRSIGPKSNTCPSTGIYIPLGPIKLEAEHRHRCTAIYVPLGSFQCKPFHHMMYKVCISDIVLDGVFARVVLNSKC